MLAIEKGRQRRITVHDQHEQDGLSADDREQWVRLMLRCHSVPGCWQNKSADGSTGAHRSTDDLDGLRLTRWLTGTPPPNAAQTFGLQEKRYILTGDDISDDLTDIDPAGMFTIWLESASIVPACRLSKPFCLLYEIVAASLSSICSSSS